MEIRPKPRDRNQQTNKNTHDDRHSDAAKILMDFQKKYLEVSSNSKFNQEELLKQIEEEMDLKMSRELQSAVLTESKDFSKSSTFRRDPTNIFNEILVNRISSNHPTKHNKSGHEHRDRRNSRIRNYKPKSMNEIIREKVREQYKKNGNDQTDIAKLLNKDIELNMETDRLKTLRENFYREIKEETEKLIIQNTNMPAKKDPFVHQGSIHTSKHPTESGFNKDSFYSSSNGRIVVAAQKAIDQTQKGIEETSQLHQKQVKLYKKLLKAQSQKESERYKRQGRKKKHIDINGIIDSQLRVDGIVKDYFHNQIISSKKIGLQDYRYKNQGGFWKPNNYSSDEFNVIYNVTKMTLPESLESHFDMRLIRSSDGSGMGNAFFFNKSEVYQERIPDSTTMKVLSKIEVNHYEESPEIKRILPRPSDFRAYQLHSQSFLKEMFENNVSRKSEPRANDGRITLTERNNLHRQRNTANQLAGREESKNNANGANASPLAYGETITEESLITSVASDISESNIRDVTGTIELGDGKRIRVDRHGNTIKAEKKFKIQLLVDLLSNEEEKSWDSEDEDGELSYREESSLDLEISFFNIHQIPLDFSEIS
ncbi:unnamed protein product [Moneuplotes crassus]|uniref:Uncharacterized protein n=2 Tax=Euplotes crassus TaxID=5936 RepID=A0AAD2DAY2_EUPCR|nr:unnamed protein product [Moneuplotes crassus]